MREAKNPEEAVRSRLRSVLPDISVRDQDPDDWRGSLAPTPAGAAAVWPASPGPPGDRPPWPTGDEGPVSWSDLIPSWPEDLDRPEQLDHDPAVAMPRAADLPSSPPDPPSGVGGAWSKGDGEDYSWQFEDGAGQPVDSPSFDEPDRPPKRIGAGAFDPGRRGVKALAAVAVLVVAIAGFLAWRSRPQVDPVPPVAGGMSAPVAADGVAGGVPAARPSAGGEVVIAVAGKVKKPGLVRLPTGSRVADALQAAGGADPGVDVSLLNLARKVVDGELILVGVTAPPGSVVAPGPAGGGTPQGPLNLNTATLADLDTLPGVGPVLAQRILDARDAQGGFRSVSDLRKVDGIGDSRYEQLKDLVTV